jgi:predicted nucleic acid-binding protein
VVVLLDSGPVGRLMEHDRLLIDQLLARGNIGDVVEVPAPVRAELFAGAWSNRTLRTRLQQVLAGLGGEPTTTADGDYAGELLGRLLPARRRVSVVDALVAAAAHRRGGAIVTDDPDFHRLRDEGGARIVILQA